ncbi:MAG: thiol-disulfide oxidoreductase DCC family protein [Burkholderiaceae bacterium]|nr:thiol-disulfide oxidoreductase DCC family protein [Burkholderiaceae bacterium]
MKPAYSYRQDPAVPAFPDDRPILIYDGVCAMCSAGVQFMLRHDKRGRFRFIAAQSALGCALYLHYGMDPEHYESNVVLEHGIAWFKSESSIRMMTGLGFPWTLVGALRVFPLSWRNRFYDYVAANRFRWFGRREVCMLADPGHAERFLSEAP